MKHTILYVAANPLDTDRLALDEECAAIERELRMTACRDDFEFRSKWAVSVDELMRHLNEMEPAVLHFSGHSSAHVPGASGRSGAPQQGITGAHGAGILLQEGQSRQVVSDRALARMIASAGPSTRVVVLNACYSAEVADALRRGVDCVAGIDNATAHTAARSFAVAFYRALGNRRSIGNAIEQAAAVLEAKHPGTQPLFAVRDGLDADRIFLPTAEHSPPASGAPPARGAAKDDPHAGSPSAEQRALSQELLGRLANLLPSQFEEVVFRMGVSTGHLPGGSASPNERALAVIRTCEQRKQLEQLARLVQQMTGGA